IEVRVRTMDLREIAAEKIRAAATRVRYRDFYDLFLILEAADIELDSVVDLVRQKEVRAPIGPAQIQQNWQEAQRQTDDDLRSIHCSRQIEHVDISALVSRLQFEPILPMK